MEYSAADAAGLPTKNDVSVAASLRVKGATIMLGVYELQGCGSAPNWTIQPGHWGELVKMRYVEEPPTRTPVSCSVNDAADRPADVADSVVVAWNCR